MELPIFEKKMFHRSLVAARGQGISEDNTNDNVNDNNESVDLFASFETAPASPGMESLLQEQSEAAKKIPKNVRFNQAYVCC